MTRLLKNQVPVTPLKAPQGTMASVSPQVLFAGDTARPVVVTGGSSCTFGPCPPTGSPLDTTPQVYGSGSGITHNAVAHVNGISIAPVQADAALGSTTTMAWVDVATGATPARMPVTGYEAVFDSSTVGVTASAPDVEGTGAVYAAMSWAPTGKGFIGNASTSTPLYQAFRIKPSGGTAGYELDTGTRVVSTASITRMVVSADGLLFTNTANANNLSNIDGGFVGITRDNVRATCLGSWVTATVVATFTDSTTLDVTAVSGGVIVVGSRVMAASDPVATNTAILVTAFGTGQGGVGTYTVGPVTGTVTVPTGTTVSQLASPQALALGAWETAVVSGTFASGGGGLMVSVSGVTSGKVRTGGVITASNAAGTKTGTSVIANQVTGTPGGIGLYTLGLNYPVQAVSSTTGVSTVAASFTATISTGTVLEVTAITAGYLAVGTVITSLTPTRTITQWLTGAGGTGSYTVTLGANVASPTTMTTAAAAGATASVTGCTLDVTGVGTGTFAVGAEVSIGAAATVITALGTGTGGTGTYMVGVMPKSADGTSVTNITGPNLTAAGTGTVAVGTFTGTVAAEGTLEVAASPAPTGAGLSPGVVVASVAGGYVGTVSFTSGGGSGGAGTYTIAAITGSPATVPAATPFVILPGVLLGTRSYVWPQTSPDTGVAAGVLRWAGATPTVLAVTNSTGTPAAAVPEVMAAVQRPNWFFNGGGASTSLLAVTGSYVVRYASNGSFSSLPTSAMTSSENAGKTATGTGSTLAGVIRIVGTTVGGAPVVLAATSTTVYARDPTSATMAYFWNAAGTATGLVPSPGGTVAWLEVDPTSAGDVMLVSGSFTGTAASILAYQFTTTAAQPVLLWQVNPGATYAFTYPFVCTTTRFLQYNVVSSNAVLSAITRAGVNVLGTITAASGFTPGLLTLSAAYKGLPQVGNAISSAITGAVVGQARSLRSGTFGLGWSQTVGTAAAPLAVTFVNPNVVGSGYVTGPVLTLLGASAAVGPGTRVFCDGLAEGTMVIGARHSSGTAQGQYNLGLQQTVSTGSTLTAVQTGATFTGSIAGTTLSVSDVTGSDIKVGDVVLGAGVTVPTVVVALLEDPSTFAVGVPQTVSAGFSFTATGPSATFTAGIFGAVLTVTAVSSGTLAVGATLSAVGITAGTVIVAPAAVTTAAGVGSWIVGTPQAVDARPMSTQSATATGTMAGGVITFDPAPPMTLRVGDLVSGSGILPNTTVTAVASTTSCTTNVAQNVTSLPLMARATTTTAPATGTIGATINGVNMSVSFGSSAIRVGMILTGTGVSANTTVTGGGGSVWTVTPSQSVNTTTQMNLTTPATVNFTGTISGNTLSITSATNAVAVGMLVTGDGVTANSVIVSGLSVVWALSKVSTVASPTAMTGTVLPETTFTADVLGTTLTVTSVSSGRLAAGMVLTGTGLLPNTGIQATGTGTGDTGTYTLNIAQSSLTGVSMTASLASALFSGSVFGTTLTVSSVTQGIIGAGVGLAGVGTGITPGTIITGPAPAPSTGSTPTVWYVSPAQYYPPLWSSSGGASFQATLQRYTMTVLGVVSGALAVGDTIFGPGLATGTTIASGSGSSWTVSVGQTVASPTALTLRPYMLTASMSGTTLTVASTPGWGALALNNTTSGGVLSAGDTLVGGGLATDTFVVSAIAPVYTTAVVSTVSSAALAGSAVSLVGSVVGQTLTVHTVAAGSVALQTQMVVAAAAGWTGTITSQVSGTTGGVGTYTVAATLLGSITVTTAGFSGTASALNAYGMLTLSSGSGIMIIGDDVTLTLSSPALVTLSARLSLYGTGKGTEGSFAGTYYLASVAVSVPVAAQPMTVTGLTSLYSTVPGTFDGPGTMSLVRSGGSDTLFYGHTARFSMPVNTYVNNYPAGTGGLVLLDGAGNRVRTDPASFNGGLLSVPQAVHPLRGVANTVVVAGDFTSYTSPTSATAVTLRVAALSVASIGYTTLQSFTPTVGQRYITALASGDEASGVSCYAGGASGLQKWGWAPGGTDVGRLLWDKAVLGSASSTVSCMLPTAGGTYVAGNFVGVSDHTVVTASISGTTLTASATAGGILRPGQVITSGAAPGTVIMALGTGTGANASGTYTVNIPQTVASTTMTAASVLASFTATISGNTMTVSAVASGVLAAGQVVTSGAVPGTVIVALGNGGGGAGTYTVSLSQTVGTATTMTTGTALLPVTFVGDIADGTLTVTSVSNFGGGLAVGQVITTGAAAGTFITALGSGAGGPGTYTVSGPSQTVAAGTTMTAAVVMAAPVTFQATIVGTTMTVSAVDGAGFGLGKGHVITTGAAAGTVITDAAAGGGTGVYTVTPSQTVGFPTAMTAQQVPASFTATSSTNTLTVSAWTAGFLAPGQLLGAGLSPGTTIVAYGSGTGGMGTYTTNVSQTVGSDTAFAALATPTFTAFLATIGTNTLIVTAVLAGVLTVGQVVGSGAAAGTVITGLGTGTGGVGTYIVNIAQTVASETAMTATLTPVQFTGTLTGGTTLIVSAVASGVLTVGHTIVTGGPTGVAISALDSGTGGFGTYILSDPSADIVSATAMTTCSPAPTAVFEAGTTGVPSTTLTVTSVASGTIVVGMELRRGNSEPAYIAGFDSGTGGLGTYTLSVANTITDGTTMAAVLYGGATFSGSTSGASTTLTAATPAAGWIAVGQALSGGSIAAGTSITGRGTGAGGSGTYIMSISQSLGATTVTATPTGAASFTGTIASGTLTVLAVHYGVLRVGLVITVGAAAGATISALSGSTGGAGIYALTGAVDVESATDMVAAEATPVAVVTGTISGTTLTVQNATAGVVALGQGFLTGADTATAGRYLTRLTAAGTGTGGTGTYTVNASQTVATGTRLLLSSGVQPYTSLVRLNAATGQPDGWALPSSSGTIYAVAANAANTALAVGYDAAFGATTIVPTPGTAGTCLVVVSTATGALLWARPPVAPTMPLSFGIVNFVKYRAPPIYKLVNAPDAVPETLVVGQADTRGPVSKPNTTNNTAPVMTLQWGASPATFTASLAGPVLTASGVTGTISLGTVVSAGAAGIQVCSFTGVLVGSTLIVTAVASGVLRVGLNIRGDGGAALTPDRVLLITAVVAGSGGPGTYTVNDADGGTPGTAFLPDVVQVAAFTGTISGTVLTVTAVSAGSLRVGQIVRGVANAALSPDRLLWITDLTTGQGAAGTYVVSDGLGGTPGTAFAVVTVQAGLTGTGGAGTYLLSDTPAASLGSTITTTVVSLQAPALPGQTWVPQTDGGSYTLATTDTASGLLLRPREFNADAFPTLQNSNMGLGSWVPLSLTNTSVTPGFDADGNPTATATLTVEPTVSGRVYLTVNASGGTVKGDVAPLQTTLSVVEGAYGWSNVGVSGGPAAPVYMAATNLGNTAMLVATGTPTTLEIYSATSGTTGATANFTGPETYPLGFTSQRRAQTLCVVFPYVLQADILATAVAATVAHADGTTSASQAVGSPAGTAAVAAAVTEWGLATVTPVGVYLTALTNPLFATAGLTGGVTSGSYTFAAGSYTLLDPAPSIAWSGMAVCMVASGADAYVLLVRVSTMTVTAVPVGGAVPASVPASSVQTLTVLACTDGTAGGTTALVGTSDGTSITFWRVRSSASPVSVASAPISEESFSLQGSVIGWYKPTAAAGAAFQVNADVTDPTTYLFSAVLTDAAVGPATLSTSGLTLGQAPTSVYASDTSVTAVFTSGTTLYTTTFGNTTWQTVPGAVGAAAGGAFTVFDSVPSVYTQDAIYTFTPIV
jgi:hypothetical protein